MNKISDDVINIAMLNSGMLGEDIVESYIPFVSTLISQKHYELFDVSEIVKDFREKYFEIPMMPMTEILSRMLKKKFLTRKRDKGGIFIPNYEKIKETDFEDISRENFKKYQNIKNKYIEFAKARYGYMLTDEEAEDNLSNFIKENYLDTIINEDIIKQIAVEQESVTKDSMYILYRFVIHLHDNDYDLFDVLKNFCIGYTVARVWNLDNISAIRKRFENKKIYFDTKIILRLLGTDGKFYKDAYEEILEILKENECKLFIFEHTFDEIKEILKNAQYNIKNKINYAENIPSVQKFFLEEKISEGEIELWIATLEKTLKDLGIKISKIGYQKETERYQINPKELYECITDIYKRR